MIVVHSDDETRGEQVVAVEKAGPGIAEESGVGIPISDGMPAVPRGELAGILLAIVGTIATAILAAAAAANADAITGWHAAAIGIAIGTALINLAHVVGLTLFESVRYHGGFAKLFRTLSLVGTPVAVLANLLILLFA